MKNVIFSILAVMFIGLSANAQDESKFGDTPEEQQKCKECISLYREYRDQNMQNDALPFWRCALNTCPKSAKTLYIDGAKFYGTILDRIYEDSTKLDERNAYIDTLMMIYDKRIEHFNEEGKVLTFKGNDLFKYDASRAAESNAMFKRSLELEGMDSDAIAASKYYQTLYEMYKEKKASKSDLLVEYMPVVEILDYNIARLEDDGARDRYEKAKNNLDAFFIKIAECDDIYSILGERLAETPNDIELNIKALAVMNTRDCSDNILYDQVAERVYKDKPSHGAAYSIGIQKLKSKDYNDALKYFEEAIDLCTGDCIRSNQYYLRAGQTALILGQSAKTRNFANKILQTSPNNGEAYILIGDAIAHSAKSCDDGKLGTVGAYWLATDYYAKAKSIDSSVTAKANQKIASYSKQFPLKTELFFHNLHEGDKYTVGCANNEVTTVRSRD